ncbi:MAG: NAD-dependent epimerase/dehydratase family protein [Vicinamibacteria bacterium]|jgi:nucleoside-diphosphate-sugar epimerase|nr:NAD-dependent epimerase/dehydratase family protein [Vicinamibacteria bacterium]
MKVALTGATGYTGGRLLEALLARGHDVRALTRQPKGPSLSPAARVEWICGDLADEAALARLVAGVAGVIHVAAVYRTAGHPDSYYRDVNVGGTERLLEAASRAGVRRFVHTSTVGVLGDVKHPPADETAPFAPSDIYQETKAEAERLALGYHGRHGMSVAVVRPGAIYGPGETRLLKLFRAIASGRYAVVGPGHAFYHLVYIDDLIDGFLLALERDEAAGEVFIVAGPRYVSQNELAALIARATGGRVWPFHIPAWPLRLSGAICEAICVPLGIEPPLHRRRMEFWMKSRAFSIDKSRRLLGYAPRVDVEDGIERTAAWYREAGWL